MKEVYNILEREIEKEKKIVKFHVNSSKTEKKSTMVNKIAIIIIVFSVIVSTHKIMKIFPLKCIGT